MDELIEDFLVETQEGLEELDNDLVTLEKNPADKDIIAKIFRVMHTIKGTCGFLGLSRLEKIAHAGEDIFDQIRSGDFQVTPDIISLVFESLDAIKDIMSYIEENESEPEGDDSDLVSRLRACAESGGGAASSTPTSAAIEAQVDEAPATQELPSAEPTSSTQDSDELQRLFDETEPLVDVSNNAPNKATKSESLRRYSEVKQNIFDHN